jgi:hypothetical protein
MMQEYARALMDYLEEVTVKMQDAYFAFWLFANSIFQLGHRRQSWWRNWRLGWAAATGEDESEGEVLVLIEKLEQKMS